jgi:hypothetical protein
MGKTITHTCPQEWPEFQHLTVLILFSYSYDQYSMRLLSLSKPLPSVYQQQVDSSLFLPLLVCSPGVTLRQAHTYIHKKKKKHRGFSPQANYT